jgi:hypothetical protein
MEWQTADWFFVVIFLIFIAMLFVGRGARGARGKDGGTDGQRRSDGEKGNERQGPRINM